MKVVYGNHILTTRLEEPQIKIFETKSKFNLLYMNENNRYQLLQACTYSGSVGIQLDFTSAVVTR